MKRTRLEFLKLAAGLAALGPFAGCGAGRRGVSRIDPKRCNGCGACARACQSRHGSAVRAAIDYAPCGYCKSCYAYFVNVENLSFEPDALVCKNGALTRRRLAEWRFLYTVNLRKCTGCGACVRTCLRKVIRLFVSPELCDRCGECAARAACRRGAFG